VAGIHASENGAQDLYLGAKLPLIEQRQYLPEIALIPQMTVPTGSRSVTAGRVLPGLNVDCGWQVIQGLFNIELLIATNEVRDDGHRSHLEVATGLTAAVQLTRDLEAFVEWDAFYSAGASGAGFSHSQCQSSRISPYGRNGAGWLDSSRLMPERRLRNSRRRLACAPAFSQDINKVEYLSSAGKVGLTLA
jgi:hypothetical protein